MMDIKNEINIEHFKKIKEYLRSCLYDDEIDEEDIINDPVHVSLYNFGIFYKTANSELRGNAIRLAIKKEGCVIVDQAIRDYFEFYDPILKLGVLYGIQECYELDRKNIIESIRGFENDLDLLYIISEIIEEIEEEENS